MQIFLNPNFCPFSLLIYNKEADKTFSYSETLSEILFALKFYFLESPFLKFFEKEKPQVELIPLGAWMLVRTKIGYASSSSSNTYAPTSSLPSCLTHHTSPPWPGTYPVMVPVTPTLRTSRCLGLIIIPIVSPSLTTLTCNPALTLLRFISSSSLWFSSFLTPKLAIKVV